MASPGRVQSSKVNVARLKGPPTPAASRLLPQAARPSSPPTQIAIHPCLPSPPPPYPYVSVSLGTLFVLPTVKLPNEPSPISEHSETARRIRSTPPQPVFSQPDRAHRFPARSLGRREPGTDIVRHPSASRATVRRRAESPTSGHPNFCGYPIYPNRVIMLRRETGWQPPCHHRNGP
jgi:hypothetical protein